MRYYTKEWYKLMQSQDYTSGMKKIPDKVYTDEEIMEFYLKKRQRAIARDRREHDEPPKFFDVSETLTPERFDPEHWRIFDDEGKECRQPVTADEVREQLEQDRKRVEEAFAAREPFDPTETIADFECAYRNGIRWASSWYPAWVLEEVDKRLLALGLMPDSAYRRLKKEEKQNKKAFERIENEARAALDAQEVPERIREIFCFHDDHILSFKKEKADYVMILRTGGMWEKAPYGQVIFKNAVLIEREKGLTIRPREDCGCDGGMTSNCSYLYDELYRTPDGYEVHIMVWTKELKYLTVSCENIEFESVEDWQR